MEDFTLAELDEYITILFERTRERDEQKSSIEAATRCFYEYESIMKESKTSELATSIIIGKLLIKYSNRIFIGQEDLILNAAREAIAKPNELELRQEEQIKLVSWANSLIEMLPKMEIEYNPSVK